MLAHKSQIYSGALSIILDGMYCTSVTFTQALTCGCHVCDAQKHPHSPGELQYSFYTFTTSIYSAIQQPSRSTEAPAATAEAISGLPD